MRPGSLVKTEYVSHGVEFSSLYTQWGVLGIVGVVGVVGIVGVLGRVGVVGVMSEY
jgi:hypothetical protein